MWVVNGGLMVLLFKLKGGDRDSIASLWSKLKWGLHHTHAAHATHATHTAHAAHAAHIRRSGLRFGLLDDESLGGDD